MQIVEFLSNVNTYTAGETRNCQIIVESGVYSKNSQFTAHFTIPAVANGQIIYNTKQMRNMVKAQLRINNIICLNVEDLSQLQLDNYVADTPVDSFVQNIYNNDAGQQNFEQIDQMKYQPTYFTGTAHVLTFKFVDIFPCFTDDLIHVQNQMIIDFQFSCAPVCKSISNANAFNDAPIDNGTNFFFKAQMINLRNVQPQKNSQIYVDQQQLMKSDNDYFINVLPGEQIYSVIFSIKDTAGELNLTQMQLFVNQLQIISGNSTIDIENQIQQYRINDIKKYVINFKQVITQPLNIYWKVTQPADNDKLFVTYFMTKP